jgi:hypothetical protein
MKRVVYIGKECVGLSYGQTGYLTENDVFVPDGTVDMYPILASTTNFIFLEE